MTSEESIRTDHALNLLRSLQRMRTEDFICDFMIKVGTKQFSVHRSILAGCSKYFEALFSSKMKEFHDNMIDMKQVTEKAIEKCVNFMYSGSVKLEMESIGNLLYASHLLQLDGLSKLALQYLAKNLQPENCLEVISFADIYGDVDLVKKADKIAVLNFSTVISSNSFCRMKKSDLLRYIPKVGFETSWQAITTWSRGHGNNFELICRDVLFQRYPFDLLLNTILKDPLVQQNKAVRTKVIEALFMYPGKLQKNLSPVNCIELRMLTNNQEIDKKVEDVILEFMKSHFEELVKQRNFVKIDKSDFLMLVKISNTKAPSEMLKWEAMMKWIKFDLKKRKKNFQELFEFIKLDRLPLEFLQENIQTEPLVSSSLECSTFLMKALFLKANQLSEENKKLKRTASIEALTESELEYCEEGAVGFNFREWSRNLIPKQHDQDFGDKIRLVGQSMTGQVDESSLPGYEGWQTMVIRYVFKSGEHRGLKYDGTEFTAYLPRNTYLYNQLVKAYKAGYTFKLEKIPSMPGRGRIVWGDIPHKTKATGGRESNGFPDPEYESELENALQVCGVIPR